MALSRSKTAEVPTDAIVISEDQALRYQWKIVKSWEKAGEVWALRHSVTVGAVMASVTGIYINNHFRRKLRLGTSGQFSTYMPIVVIPAIFTVLTHKFFVQRTTLLDPLGECPVCLQVRAAALQTSCGVLYPTILAPFAVSMFATRHFTYRLPAITEKPMEVLQLWRKMARPIMPTLGYIAIGQALVMMYLTYKEIDQSVQLLSNMKRIEEAAEQKEAEAGFPKKMY